MTIRLSRFILFSFSLFLVISSCSKINEATDLGDETIPEIDGVHTFDTTFLVETYDTIFNPTKDSIRVGRTDDHILGNIVGDPFFGKTNAKIFLELKPGFYPWNFSGVFDDSLYIDSVVLVLGWNATYGDTSAPQRVSVYELDPSNEFKIDSFGNKNMLREQYFTYNSNLLLGTKDFFPYQLNDSLYSFQDTTAGQLRIKLNTNFGQRLLDYDTTDAYRSDSAFKEHFKGFAIAADESFGNALMAFGIYNNPKTKLAIYYHYTKDGQSDKAVSYFQFTNSSAQHNYINRFNFSNTLAAATWSSPQDDYVYLINAPGSYATIKIPGLQNLSNRVVNRAELIAEQVYDPLDITFTPPDALMLDVFDSALGTYKYVPYDFSADRQTGAVNPVFGSYGKNTADGAGQPIRVWKFNITRYVQNVLTKKESLHEFRIFTHRGINEGMYVPSVASYDFITSILNPRFAFGRVRLGGGNRPTQNMRLRMVWTKI